MGFVLYYKESDKLANLYKLVPYHNILHAILVAKQTNDLLKKVKSDANFNKTAKSLILAALFHDAAHTGLGNDGCAKESLVKNGLCIISYTNNKHLELGEKQEYIKEVLGLTNNDNLNISGYEDFLRRALRAVFCSNIQLNEECPAIDLILGIVSNSAELSHAFIAYNFIPTLSDYENISKNINLGFLAVAILGTHVGLHFNKDFQKIKAELPLNQLYELVHFADILGNTFEDEPYAIQLIQLQIECVHFEFAFESKLYTLKSPITEKSTVSDLFNSQINFLNRLVLIQIQNSHTFTLIEKEKTNEKPLVGSVSSYVNKVYLDKLLKYLKKNVIAFEEVKKTAEESKIKLKQLFEDIDFAKLLARNLYAKFIAMPKFF